MKELKCPNCGTLFTIDEREYSNIVSQIKDNEFEEELNKRIEQVKQIYNKQTQLEKNEVRQESINEINSLKLAIESLKKEIEAKDKEKNDAVLQVIAKTKLENELEITKLKAEIDRVNQNSRFDLEKKNSEIEALKDKVNDVKNEVILKAQEKENELNTIIKLREQEIEQIKDFKSKLSTKLVGESLEQHCYNKFNEIRPVLNNNNIYFEKDNKVSSSGSKGDFIYREKTDNGAEVLSIMFEMKNEMDTTATKHKNEDFLAELDKDRKEKKCEYAILVSMLEENNEFYNTGIVDMSHKYEKMYVVRPQFFIPIITILRNASLNIIESKEEIERLKEQNIDVTNFENKLFSFQEDFSKNFDSAKNHFEKVISSIDDTISKLNKIKDELQTTGNQLRLANNKAQELTIKKLTHNNKTMQEMFKNLDKE